MPPKSNFATKEDVNRLEKHLSEIKLIIQGSKELGVEGLRERQEKDDAFKDHVEKEFARLEKVIKDGDDAIMKALTKRIDPIESWKNNVEWIFNLVVSAKFWAVLFIVLGTIVTISLMVVTQLHKI
jgi:hypothetical protein